MSKAAIINNGSSVCIADRVARRALRSTMRLGRNQKYSAIESSDGPSIFIGYTGAHDLGPDDGERT